MTAEQGVVGEPCGAASQEQDEAAEMYESYSQGEAINALAESGGDPDKAEELMMWMGYSPAEARHFLNQVQTPWA